MKDEKIWLDLYSKKDSRTTKKQNYLLGFIRPGRQVFLELFAGTGHNALTIKSRNPSLVCIGVDYDFELCRNASRNGYLSVAADCRLLPFKQGVFDIIYANSYHHVSGSIAKVLQSSVSLLKRGGLLIGIEPYGEMSAAFAKVICLVPDFMIFLLSGKLGRYLKAIKYECENEGVMNWYKRVFKEFKNELSRYNVIHMSQDLFRIYYCVKKG